MQSEKCKLKTVKKLLHASYILKNSRSNGIAVHMNMEHLEHLGSVDGNVNWYVHQKKNGIIKVEDAHMLWSNISIPKYVLKESLYTWSGDVCSC